MKIVCDACAAKYSIADEKVAGKVFKIRCKKCSNVIVVRGAAEAEAGAPELEQKETRVFDYSGYDNPQEAVAAAESSIGDGAVWHIVIDQEQVGPLSPEEVRAHFARGDVDGESFIWREGFADWERIDSLSEFADLAGGNVDDAAAAMFGGPALDEGIDDDPADLFTAQSAESMAAAAPAEAGGGGLFGGAADDGGLFGGMTNDEPATMAASPADDKLKGQRNENSVLFSLNNLASLASDAPKSSSPSPSAAPASSGGAAPAPGQEGSGLIDIRAMASMYVGNNDQAAGGSAASIDDLPVFSQPAIASASPVLMPVAAPANSNKVLVALIAGIGALVLVAVLLVILVLKGGDKDEPKAAANTDNSSNTANGSDTNTNTDTNSGKTVGDGDKGGDGDGTAASGDGDGTPASGKTGPDPAAEAAAAKKAEAEAKKAAEREAKRKEREERLKNETPAQRRAREKKEKKEREARKKKEEERKKKREEERRKKEAAAASKKGGCDELDCLVNPNKACCRKGKSSNDTKKPDSNLPSRPPKSALSKGMGKARGSAKSCAAKANFSGKVSVKVRVSGSGRVSSARASGGKGSVNSCVASAVKRKARFPKSQNGISFTYSYRL